MKVSRSFIGLLVAIIAFVVGYTLVPSQKHVQAVEYKAAPTVTVTESIAQVENVVEKVVYVYVYITTTPEPLSNLDLQVLCKAMITATLGAPVIPTQVTYNDDVEPVLSATPRVYESAGPPATQLAPTNTTFPLETMPVVRTLSPSTTPQPTNAPTVQPTLIPTFQPTYGPPTLEPTLQPTNAPTQQPTSAPTDAPTVQPTLEPTTIPEPTDDPTVMPPEDKEKCNNGFGNGGDAACKEHGNGKNQDNTGQHQDGKVPGGAKLLQTPIPD